jgi:hypothetical protein
MDIVLLFAAIEQKFGILIPDTEAQEADTPGKLADLIWSKLQSADPPTRLTESHVWQIIHDTIVEETGVTDFTRDSHFVTDMDLD